MPIGILASSRQSLWLKLGKDAQLSIFRVEAEANETEGKDGELVRLGWGLLESLLCFLIGQGCQFNCLGILVVLKIAQVLNILNSGMPGGVPDLRIGEAAV